MSGAARRRLVESSHVVSQRRARPAKAQLQAPNLENPTFDHERLARQTYLTLREFAELYRRPSVNAARMWLKRHPAIPLIRMGGSVLVARRDVEREIERQSEEAIQPSRDRHAGESRPALVRAKGHA
jgi:hypothetical protein